MKPENDQMTQEDQQLLNEILAKGSISPIRAKSLWKKIKQLDVKDLQPNNPFQRDPLILKSMSHIVFSKLDFLNLSYNKIESLEGIHRITFPVMKKLWMHKNKVRLLKDLSKCFWPRLQNLDLSGNHICDWQCLHQLKQIQFNILSVDSAQYLQSNGLCWIFKIESKQFRKVYHHNEKRINQPKFINCRHKCFLKYQK